MRTEVVAISSVNPPEKQDQARLPHFANERADINPATGIPTKIGTARKLCAIPPRGWNRYARQRREMTFADEYHELEARFRTLAEADGEVYLPNVEPTGPVQHVFVAMEPSIGRWAGRSASPAARARAAREKVEAGFRNFVADEVGDVVLLHHAIRQYLGTSYHLTDFSKGAMLVDRAKGERAERYDRWYPLLLAELRLVGPQARVWAVGRDPAAALRDRGFTDFAEVLHYSSRAGLARARAVRGHEAQFEAFRETVTMKDVLGTAEAVLQPVPAWLREQTLRALARTQLTPSKAKLMFSYKLAFDP
jgi:hypothetical protein